MSTQNKNTLILTVIIFMSTLVFAGEGHKHKSKHGYKHKNEKNCNEKNDTKCMNASKESHDHKDEVSHESGTESKKMKKND